MLKLRYVQVTFNSDRGILKADEKDCPRIAPGTRLVQEPWA